MKRHLTALEELLLAYSNLEYVSGEFFNGEELVSSEADSILEDFYDGFEGIFAHSSGNPEDEYSRECTGREYIEQAFDCNYEKAFENVVNFTRVLD